MACFLFPCSAWQFDLADRLLHMNINLLTEKKNSQVGDTVNISETTNCSVGSEPRGLSSKPFEGILKQAYANFKFLL